MNLADQQMILEHLGHQMVLMLASMIGDLERANAKSK
jgi:hypothetical protein